MYLLLAVSGLQVSVGFPATVPRALLRNFAVSLPERIEYFRGTFVLERRAEKELEEIVCGREIFGLSLKIHSRKKNCKVWAHQTD